jgi:hypothetical protein
MSDVLVPLIFFILFLLILGGTIYYNHRKEQEIARQLQEQVAPQLGATYVENNYQIDPNLLELLKGRFGTRGEIKNWLRGEWQKVPYELFTYTYVVRSGKSSRTYNHTIMAVSTLEEPFLPKFLIRPPEFFDGLKKMIGYEFVELPTAFNLAIQVHQEGVDDQLVFQHLPAEVWQQIRQNSLTITNDGFWFIAYLYNDRLNPNLEIYQYFLQTTLEIYEAILHHAPAGKSAKLYLEE